MLLPPQLLLCLCHLLTYLACQVLWLLLAGGCLC